MFLVRVARLAVSAFQLLLASFFLFVGRMKTMAPMEMLQLHHAWVASLPVQAARLVGVSELLCAATMIFGLVSRRAAWWSGAAAWLLVANQGTAVLFHVVRGEIGLSGPQKLLLVLALAGIGVVRFLPDMGADAGRQINTTPGVDKTERRF